MCIIINILRTKYSFDNNVSLMTYNSRENSPTKPKLLQCFACNQTDHKVYSCPVFQNKYTQTRFITVKENEHCTVLHVQVIMPFPIADIKISKLSHIQQPNDVGYTKPLNETPGKTLSMRVHLWFSVCPYTMLFTVQMAWLIYLKLCTFLFCHSHFNNA